MPRKDNAATTRIGWEHTKGIIRMFYGTHYIGTVKKTSSRWFKGYLPDGKLVTRGRNLEAVGINMLFIQERMS